ncbi:MAG: hypothetical protein WB341_14405 [Terracidiphilus sp.]
MNGMFGWCSWVFAGVRESIPAPCNHRSDTLLLKPCRLLNHEPGGLPPKYMLYVGRTVPGEWFIITVDVKHACSYDADLFYTSNRSGAISLDVNGKGATGPVNVPTTYKSADPIAWRQWHHWNLAKDLFRPHLPAGKNVLTVHVLKEGNMNFAYFDFHAAD